jgi:mRNA-degrading endonuclease RelE of RelBE toxin-antitoxin system
MYQVLLERAAEKGLARLSPEIHDRVIAAIQALASNPVRTDAANWLAARTTGASASATTA